MKLQEVNRWYLWPLLAYLRLTGFHYMVLWWGNWCTCYWRNQTPSPRMMRHELVHAAQWNRYKWRFPFIYIWYQFRYGYQRNPFEVEAREAE